jgi:Flp pilus assembly pilin Flp
VLHERLLSALAGAHAWWNVRRGRVADPTGATAVEYAIMLAFIAALIVGAVALLGQATKSNFEKVVFP